MFKEIKWFIQRGKRGWSDRDIWSFDNYLCEIIPPAVRELKNGSGCPSGFYDEKNINNECQKWYDILEEIAQGFEASQEITELHFNWKENKTHGYVHEYDKEKNLQLTKKYNRGMDLLKKYFLSLWD